VRKVTPARAVFPLPMFLLDTILRILLELVRSGMEKRKRRRSFITPPFFIFLLFPLPPPFPPLLPFSFVNIFTMTPVLRIQKSRISDITLFPPSSFSSSFPRFLFFLTMICRTSFRVKRLVFADFIFLSFFFFPFSFSFPLFSLRVGISS